MTVRVRFAPSPTGALHLGGARTALFNYYFAKKHHGVFILRIEDTDLERSRKEHEVEILQSMAWLGMTSDEGPYYQTARFDRYLQCAHDLLERAKAYRCYCTSEELDKMRADAESRGLKPKYDGRCRKRDPRQVLAQPYVIRILAPDSGSTSFHDLIKGPIHFANEELDDFVIVRSNGSPTYNFSVAVDDYDMKITHVIRGDDHVNNTPKQLFVFAALGASAPHYAHVPMILATDKTKLSKRHGATAVIDYRSQGFLSEAVRNCLIRLGWSHGDQEFFSEAELQSEFDLNHCGTSPSVFDPVKLRWFNAHYLRQKSVVEITEMVKSQHNVDLGSVFQGPTGQLLFRAVAERAEVLGDFVTKTEWLRTRDFQKDSEAVSTILAPAPAEIWPVLRSCFTELAKWDGAGAFAGVKQAASSLGKKPPELAKPLRVLLTGTMASPDMGIVLESLGREEVLGRLDAYLTGG